MSLRNLGKILSKFAYLIQTISKKRAAINAKMKERYSPLRFAFLGVGACFLVSVIILFAPPFLGVANDGIGNHKMQEYGLSYRKADLVSEGTFASNAYFTKSYEMHETMQEICSSQSLVIDMAKTVDYFFTRDNLFDVRFLASIYLLLYLPGVFLVLYAALERVSFFSEGAALTIFGVLIFSDISYLAYFNSLYEEALIFICMLYLAGAALSLHKERKRNVLYIILYTAAAVVLCLLEKKFFLAGILLSVFLFAQFRIFDKSHEKVLIVFLTCILLGSSLFSLLRCNEEFDETGKFHAMTRGVLFQSQKPDQALEDLGIDVSYSVLADCSLYDYYPVSEIDNRLLREGFLDQYSTADIVLFYIHHPKALVSMWDIGIKAAFNLRRDYCGNYERSTKRPVMGKSIFWSIWSIFKSRSAPKTIGYLLILVIAFSVMSGRKIFNRRVADRWNYVYFELMATMTLVGIADLTYVICKSGDAQLIQFNMTIGVVMDVLLYYVAAEILHKLNILEAKHEA